MTAPVMNTVSEKGTETCFYIPEEFQSNPPKPTGNGVYLSKKKEENVYAMKKSGFPNIGQEVRKLKDKLERGFANKVDFSSYMWMGYDRIYKSNCCQFLSVVSLSTCLVSSRQKEFSKRVDNSTAHHTNKYTTPFG